MEISEFNPMSCDLLKTLENSTSQQLEVAANFGKMLLQRNEYLEDVIKEYEEKICKQDAEIVRLIDQTKSLQTFHESRLKIYDLLEVNIYDLEEENKLLLQQFNKERQITVQLKENLQTLEKHCNDMQDTMDELKLQQQQQHAEVVKINRNQDELLDIVVVNENIKTQNPIDDDPQPDKRDDVNWEEENLKLKQQVMQLLEQQAVHQSQLLGNQTKIAHLELELNEMCKINNDLKDEAASSRTSSSNSNESSCHCQTDTELSLFDEIADDESFFKNVSMSSAIVGDDKATQTGVDYTCKVGEHKILIYDATAASKQSGKSICKQNKYQQLFRGVLDTFANDAKSKIVKQSTDKTFTVDVGCDNVMAEYGLVEGENQADVNVVNTKMCDESAKKCGGSAKKCGGSAKKKRQWRPIEQHKTTENVAFIDKETSKPIIPLLFHYESFAQRKFSYRTVSLTKTVHQLRNLESNYSNVLKMKN